MSTASDLFDRHHRGVFRFLVRLTGSREDAQDLAQEVFLRVVRALPAYDERRLETTGQRVLLDYVARPSSDECLRNLALELEVGHAGDAGEENRVIDYEVWLLHGDGRAGANLPPFRSSVRQGAATAFRFPAVRLEPPSGGSQDAGVDAVVEGEVRGWVRHDGGIDLVLSARRRLTLVGGGGGLFAEAGRKAASVASGEAVKFTLPNVTPPAGADPRLVGRALEGHAFSLVLVARQKG